MAEPQEAIKTTIDIVKEVLEIIRPEQDKEEDKPISARSGPLQIVGRLYIGLTIVLALSASTSAYFDSHLAKGGHLDCTTLWLRGSVVLACLAGLAAGGLLVWQLFEKGPALLSSPTEFSQSVHERLVDTGDVGKTKEPATESTSNKKSSEDDT